MQYPPITEGVTRKGRFRMARSEGSFGQAKHLLDVLTDGEATKAQYDGLVGSSWMLRSLLKHGETLKDVHRDGFERVLTPPGDYWAKLPENPFANEYSVPVGIKPISRGFYSSNHLSFSSRSFKRALGDYWNDQYLREFEENDQEVPEGFDGWYCWPKLAVIGEKLRVPDPYGLDYPVCLRYILETTNNFRRISLSEQANGLNADQLRLLPSVSKFYRKWEEKTEGAFMVGAIQLGARYAGCSPRNARYQMLNSGQFPLDPYVAVCLLLADSSMLYLDDTSIDCPGAEYARVSSGVFSDILTLENSNQTPTMHLFDQGAHPPKMRCASGFVPKGMKLEL